MVRLWRALRAIFITRVFWNAATTHRPQWLAMVAVMREWLTPRSGPPGASRVEVTTATMQRGAEFPGDIAPR